MGVIIDGIEYNTELEGYMYLILVMAKIQYLRQDQIVPIQTELCLDQVLP